MTEFSSGSESPAFYSESSYSAGSLAAAEEVGEADAEASAEADAEASAGAASAVRPGAAEEAAEAEAAGGSKHYNTFFYVILGRFLPDHNNILFTLTLVMSIFPEIQF